MSPNNDHKRGKFREIFLKKKFPLPVTQDESARYKNETERVIASAKQACEQLSRECQELKETKGAQGLV
jgi:hypothetical protein